MGAAQLGVQVVVDPAHLAHSDPVLAFEGEAQGPPAQIRGHVEDEAGHVGQGNAGHVPEGAQ